MNEPKEVYEARIQKIVNFLEREVHPDKFDMRNWVSSTNADGSMNPIQMSKDPSSPEDCGTAACMVGWFPYLFPEHFKWTKTLPDGTVFYYVDDLINDGDVQDNLKNFLCLEDINLIVHDYNATAKEVADKLRSMARDAGYNIL